MPHSKSVLDADKIIGGNIRILRGHANISQQELGRRIGVTFQQIQKYEAGTNRISAGKLVESARALGCALSSIFEGIDDSAPRDITALSPAAHKAAKLFDMMPQAQRTAFIGLLSSMTGAASG